MRDQPDGSGKVVLVGLLNELPVPAVPILRNIAAYFEIELALEDEGRVFD